MIQAELTPGKFPAAVLARIPIPNIYIKTREANMTFRHPIISYQKDYSRYFDHPVHQADRLLGVLYRELAPAFEIKGFILFVNGFGYASVEEAESPTQRGYVHRKIRPI